MATVVTNPADSALELGDELAGSIWQVRHGHGETRLMTLGEIDVALQSGELDYRAMVARIGSNAWRTLADIAGIDVSAAAIALTGEHPSLITQPGFHVPPAEDSASLAPVASSIDVTDAPDVDVQLDFDLAASPVPAFLFVPDAFSTGTLRRAGAARTSAPAPVPAPAALPAPTTRRWPRVLAAVAGVALVAGGSAAAATGKLHGVPHQARTAFATAAAAVIAPAPLAPTAFEAPEPTLAPPPATYASTMAASSLAIVPPPAAVSPPASASAASEPSAEAAAAPRPRPAARPAAPKPAGMAISTSERAWDSRRVVR